MSRNMTKPTRAGVCKTLCPQHLLVPKYGRICSVVIPQKIWTLLKYLTGNLHIIPYQLVASHFVPRSFRTQVISYLLWSFRTYFLVILYPVTTISYPGHFVPILVISYLVQLGTKWLFGGQFVPKSFRTLFGHFVPSLVIGWMHAWMDGRKGGWMDWRTDGRVLIEMTSLTLNCYIMKFFVMFIIL